MGYNPMRKQVVQILMSRDGIDEEEAEEIMNEAQQRVHNGEDPEVVCYEEFSLEPDYAEALL